MTEDHAPGLERAFVAPADQHCAPRAEGEVPAFLRGTYYLNGPACFERGGQPYRHWLDGDGMVCALRFGAEGPRLTARYVRGTRRTEEEAAGRPLYRSFGTAFPDDKLVRGVALESPLNVSIYPYGGRLLAFGEQGLPWELDAETLETRGPFAFGGALNPLSPFAAHPKVDPATGELFNFGVNFAAEPVLNLYRFDAGGDLVYRRRLPLGIPASIHDFLLSERHAIFHVGPYLVDMSRLAAGGTLMDAL
ncbi:MAG TPA: carotenoid oxygenase family protein, partial [Thermoanaerobaculia bacterium]